MESLINTFHIDIKLLLAQLVNFAVVFAVLYFFAFKPLAKIMSERTKKIEQSLQDADSITKKLAQTKQEQAEIIKQAKQEALALLQTATQDGEARKNELVVKAKQEIGLLINQEKASMQQEKANTLAEIRQEAAGLVAAAVEKILGEKLNDKNDQELIKKTLR